MDSVDRAKNENHEGFHLINVLYKLGCYCYCVNKIRKIYLQCNSVLRPIEVIRRICEYDLKFKHSEFSNLALGNGSVSRTLVDSLTGKINISSRRSTFR